MFSRIKSFAWREDGAITVDWVVLTAAVAGMCIAFVIELKGDANSLSNLTREYLLNQDPAANIGNIQDGRAPETDPNG